MFLNRVGMLYSENQTLLKALMNMGYFMAPREGKLGRSYEIFEVADAGSAVITEDENVKES